MASAKKTSPDSERKPQKSQQLILKHTEEAALTELNRDYKGLILSGVSAGMDIGFSVLLMTVILSLFNGVFSDPVVHIWVSMMYPIGFIFVVLGRSELFTEHTTLAILPVLQRLASIKKLLRLWVIVFLSNIFGGLVFAAILAFFANSLHFLDGWAVNQIAHDLLKHEWPTSLLTAALAGWLMGLLAWLVAASRETISQIFIIILVTAAIGIIGLPHCIVGSIEVAAGLFNGDVTIAQYFQFLGPVTLGNTIGGVLFVGIMKFSHTAYSGKEKEVKLDDN